MRIFPIVLTAFVISCVSIPAQASGSEFQDQESGISFRIPSGSWRRAEAEPGFVALIKDRAGSEIRVALLVMERGSGVKGAPGRAASLRELSIRKQSVREIELEGRTAHIAGFETQARGGAGMGAVIALPAGAAIAAVICEPAPGRHAQVFLSCRELASTLNVSPPHELSAPSLYARALDLMDSNPAEARRQLESAIRADPAFALAYTAFGRALLAEGVSAEMVSARLDRMLARAPETPEIRLMRQRLAGPR